MEDTPSPSEGDARSDLILHDPTACVSVEGMELRGKSGFAPSGHRAEHYDAGVLRLTFLAHRRKAYNWSMRHVVQPDTEVLAYAVSGQARYVCEDQSFDVKRGALLFFPRGVARSATADAKSPWSFYSVGFRLQPVDTESKRSFACLPRHVSLANTIEITGIFRHLERLWVGREAGWEMACRGLVLMLLQQFVSATQRQTRRAPHTLAIERCVERMHENVGRVEPVTLLAQRVGLSESRFRTLFREATGCSVTRYQNQLRIRMARDLLASGQYSVGEVAEELEFNDVYYFSRLFKRITGIPPSRCLPP